jgi:hypothetical protein
MWEVSMASTSSGSSRTPAQLVATVFGAVYLLVGVLGFTVSGGHPAAGHMGGLLLGIFMVNTLHNVVHLLIGAALLVAGLRGHRPAALADATVGVAYLVVFLYGLVVPLSSAANVVALNAADNVLHLASAVLLGVVGIAGLRRRPAVSDRAGI